MSKLQISIPVSIFKEEDSFVAYTPALDISTCGTTLEEVKKHFAELVTIFFEELDRKGTTEEVLESMGVPSLYQSTNLYRFSLSKTT